MIIRKIAATTAASGILMLSMSGLALADNDVTISDTGADSTSNVTVTSSSTLVVTNAPVVTVNNTNDQTAVGGDIDIDDSTGATAGGTGNTSNNASFVTNVGVSMPEVPVPGGGTIGGGSGGGSMQGGGTGGGSSTKGGGVGGGNLASASGGVGGGALLPDTGASGPVSVEALRNLFKPSAHAQALANETQNTSRALLAAGAILSLLGAIGSAVYANKKNVKA